MRRVIALLFLAFSASCRRPEPPPAPPPAPLVFGAARSVGAEAGARLASEGAAWLASALGRPVEGRLFSYDELADGLAAGKVDFAMLPPRAYVRAAEKSAVVPVRRAVHRGQVAYRAVLFVRAASPAKSLEDLQGKRMAWVREGSTSGNLYPRVLLAATGHDPTAFFSEQLFLADHAEVCKAVHAGQADAGASFSGTADETTPDSALPVDACDQGDGGGSAGLRVLTASRPIPNDVLAARAALDAKVLAGLEAALGRAASGEAASGEAAAALRTAFGNDGFAPVSDADFAPVRQAVKVLAETR